MTTAAGIIQPYGVAISEAVSRGDAKEMQELAVVSGYLKRTLPIDPSTEQGKAWGEAHQKLLDAISSQNAIDVRLAPSDLLSTGAGGVTVIQNVQFAEALRTLMTSQIAGQYIKLSLA